MLSTGDYFAYIPILSRFCFVLVFWCKIYFVFKKLCLLNKGFFSFFTTKGVSDPWFSKNSINEINYR